MTLQNIIERSYPLIKKTGDDFRALLFFKINNIEIFPGQFYMMQFNGCQKPFSVNYYDNNKLAFLIENRGNCSNKILSANTGEYLGLTGPLGNYFKTEGYDDFLLIGGGIGNAPVIFLANYLEKAGKKYKILIGERSKKNFVYLDEISDLYKINKSDIMFYTDDGSFGNEGFVTKDLTGILKKNKFSSACICGPEVMMNNVIEKIIEYIPEKSIQVCMERYMKCGLGLCGSCVLDDIGLRVCAEGPVFTWDILKNSNEFGKYHRDSNGIIKKN